MPLGFVFGILFMVLASPTGNLIIIGGLIGLTGLLIRAWASGHIRKNEDLAASGPYAYTRNPLYLGSFILGLGFTISSGRWWIALLFTMLFLGIYFPVMSVEADELTDIFGEDYGEYAAQVSLFFPWFSKYQSTEKKFELQLYLRYREYQALLGAIFAWIVLTIKLFFIN